MQPTALPSLTPVLFTAGIGWIYYRRIRRQFGRQPWRQNAWRSLRLVLLAVVLGGLVLVAFTLPHSLLAIGAGIAIGAALGGFALQHTQIETVDGARWYTPNPWIGGALSLLLIARLAWRWGHGPFATGDGGGPAAMAQQAIPLTLAFAATLVTYYLVSGAGLAWRMRLPA